MIHISSPPGSLGTSSLDKMAGSEAGGWCHLHACKSHWGDQLQGRPLGIPNSQAGKTLVPKGPCCHISNLENRISIQVSRKMCQKF